MRRDSDRNMHHQNVLDSLLMQPNNVGSNIVTLGTPVIRKKTSISNT